MSREWLVKEGIFVPGADSHMVPPDLSAYSFPLAKKR